MLSVLKNCGMCTISSHVILITHCNIKDAVSEEHYLTSSGTEVGTWAIQLWICNYRAMVPLG